VLVSILAELNDTMACRSRLECFRRIAQHAHERRESTFVSLLSNCSKGLFFRHHQDAFKLRCHAELACRVLVLVKEESHDRVLVL
jgi:hypothetical protein